MPDPVQSLLAGGLVPTVTFPPTSRYFGVDVETYVPAAPKPNDITVGIPYLRRRLCPPSAAFSLLFDYEVNQNDRRDLIAAQQIGDPELWWRLADANDVIDPAELTAKVGRRLRITLGQGVPGGA